MKEKEKLTLFLIEYLLKKIGVDNSIDLKKSYSIFDEKFLNKEKINILDENNEKKSHKVYGVKYRFYDDKNQEIKFLISKIDKDYYLVIDAPESFKYGLFYNLESKEYNFCYQQNNLWNDCNMFLQFSMLAGLELCKNIFFIPYALDEDDKECIDNLISFIEYCEDKSDEG